MRPISPNIGGNEVMVAEDQLEYRPLAAARIVAYGEPALLMRWTFTPDERERIGAGEDLAVVMPRSVHPYEVCLLGDAVRMAS